MEKEQDLLTQAQAGSARAVASLLEAYRPLAGQIAKNYYLQGADRDDVLQEGMIGLYAAIQDYDAQVGASFQTFAGLCIRRRIHSAVTASARQKHQPLNSYLSLDEPDQVASGAQWIEEISPLDELIEGENHQELLATLERQLTDLENAVLKEVLTGAGHAKVAQDLGITAKAVDNALQRIRKKLRRR